MILSIIIPVFNEEKTIRELLLRVNKVKVPDVKKEIIVIDDCSNDKTAEILKGMRSLNIKILKHGRNLGKGSAVRSGIKAAKGDLIIIQDGDLEYNPQDYLKLIEPITKGKASVVFGTRLKHYPLRFFGRHKTVLPIHLIANHFLTLLVNILYGAKLTDMETGYKLFRKEVLKDFKLVSDRFEIEPEITIKTLKAGYKITEVPIHTKPRGYDEGKKIGFKDGWQAIFTIFKYKFFD